MYKHGVQGWVAHQSCTVGPPLDVGYSIGIAPSGGSLPPPHTGKGLAASEGGPLA